MAGGKSGVASGHLKPGGRSVLSFNMERMCCSPLLDLVS